MGPIWRPNFAQSAVLFFIAAGGLTFAAPRTTAAPPSRPVAFPLKVSQNKRYLVDQNGTPFLIVGDSPQGIVGRLTEKEAEAYFDDRAAHGFNTMGWINVVCAGHDYPTNTLAETPDGIRPFLSFLPGGKDYNYYDLSKPNEAYFVRLDHMVELATKHHFAVFIDPIETIGWRSTLRNNGVNVAYEYGRFLGRRYGGYANVMWVSGNDFGSWQASQDDALAKAAKEGFDSLFHTWLHRDDDSLVQAVARGIRDTAPQQLQTVELQPNTSSSFDDPAWRSLAELNGTYTYYPAYMQTLHSYNQSPTAPTFLMETRYEFDHDTDPPDDGTPYVLRKQEYWAMLSGATGEFYGNDLEWPFKDGWREKFDTAGVQQVEYWKDLFLSIPWQDLVPDQDHKILVSGSGSVCDAKSPVGKCDYAVAAKSSDGTVVLIYIPTRRVITVNLAALSHPAHATWFDPTSGEHKPVRADTFQNSGIKRFTPPGKNHSGDGDWVLLLRTESTNPPQAARAASR